MTVPATREVGAVMTFSKALAFFATSSEWLHDQSQTNANCDCGACLLCAYRFLERVGEGYGEIAGLRSHHLPDNVREPSEEEATRSKEVEGTRREVISTLKGIMSDPAVDAHIRVSAASLLLNNGW